MTTDAVAVREAKQQRAAALAVVGDAYTPEQIDVIKSTVAVGATDAELALFLTVAQRTRLDVFTKQIHFVKRWSKEQQKKVGAHQVGIDGFRVIAQRDARYRGRVGPWWCGRDGKWVDLWTDPEPPFAAKVGVVMDGWAEPVYATARWGAYAQTKEDGGYTKFWATMGPEQLAKCAEALALRIATPNDLSGLMIPEEMGDDEGPQFIKPHPAAEAIARDEKIAAVVTQSVAEVLKEDVPGEDRQGSPATDGAPGNGDEVRLSPADRAEVLANCSLDEITLVLGSLRQAAGGKRLFYETHERKGGSLRVALVDGELLTAAGSIRDGAPVKAWLDNVKAGHYWQPLCGAILKVADELGVEVIR